MSTRDFHLPDLGEGLTDAEVLAWHVDVGDHVALNQIIADVETAKAVVELPSPFDGTVSALHAPVGSTVEVGAPLLSVQTTSTDVSQPRPETTLSSDPGLLVGYGAAREQPVRRRRRSASAERSSDASGPLSPTSASPRRPRSTPPVRKLAADAGVDIAAIVGTGPHGRVERVDVMTAIAGARDVSPAPSHVSSAPQDPLPVRTRIPITGVRRATARAMVESAFTAPHVTEFLTVDVTESEALLSRLRSEGARVNMLAMVSQALLLVIDAHPMMNSRWDEESGHIVQFAAVNLGIATATDRGLIVPNIKNAQELGLLPLAERIRELVGVAREGRASTDDLRAGTITITNIGSLGIDAGTPIINPGEAAILGVGAVRRLPWNHRDEIALRDVLTLSLSFDHRLIDGADAARFLTDIGALLTDPARSVLQAARAGGSQPPAPRTP
ncbi:dihydrolipoamide acetyltransferase family protein [Microbacterium soli]|uniref:Dihydrolipoamide acetyltransferase component of pyruvate dehydrogenase complex n=1 Tax=Microbacterium soli TaxID=446075 RepID=A0ABP7NB57_9MICO